MGFWRFLEKPNEIDAFDAVIIGLLLLLILCSHLWVWRQRPPRAFWAFFLFLCWIDLEIIKRYLRHSCRQGQDRWANCCRDDCVRHWDKFINTVQHCHKQELNFVFPNVCIDSGGSAELWKLEIPVCFLGASFRKKLQLKFSFWSVSQQSKLTMPYVFVSTPIRLVSFSMYEKLGVLTINASTIFLFQETGPCRVGDDDSDPELMSYLQARRVREPGVN